MVWVSHRHLDLCCNADRPGCLRTIQAVINAASNNPASGSQLKLAYTGNIDRGTLNVYMDAVKIDGISESSVIRVWQAGLGGSTLVMDAINVLP